MAGVLRDVKDLDRAYRQRLRTVLDAESVTVQARLRRIRDAVTARTDGIAIDIFTDPDASGTFDVWARFAGADAFALDRKLDDTRCLFAVIWGEEGWEPDVPSSPRGWSRDELERAIRETVIEWIDPLIPRDELAVHWEIALADGADEPRLLGLVEGQ